MPQPLPLLRVLGPPALFGPDGEPVTFRTRKHFALLIYMALEPRVHRREQLAALLWPRATTSEARHSLSTALSVLRAKLGREGVETTRDTARLVAGTLEIDLDRLARGEIHATDTEAALSVAPLIHDFPVADATPWEQWRDGLASKWRPAIRDALLARIDRMRRQGNTRAMEVLADALIALDELSEDGIRAKMESRAFAGDRLTALQIYEDWRVRLGDELGAAPSDLVAGMATRLRRRGWERTNEEHIPAVRTDQWKDRPFVGRAKEYEVLYEGWEGCQRGTPRHTLITGESGVGKSTLMERLTTAAGLQGATAVRVQCHVVEREIPYGAIGSLIGHLLDRPGATSVAPESLSELSRTVSAVRRRFPGVTSPPEVTGEMVRINLADAFHELVRAIAEEQPLILVMDDIHLGDDASVAVMHLLLRRLTNERVAVMCTLRHEEGALAPSARGMLERAEIAQMTVLPLPPLSDAESSELLERLIPEGTDPPPPTVRRALLKAGSGLPMLLELLVRDWGGHGDRCVALAVQAMTEEPGAAGGAGETYRRLLERLTLGLDAGARSVMNLAAILGSQLNEFELYSLVDLTLAQAMVGLSQLASLRIMRDSGHGLEFVNEVMRGEVYLAVPSSVRKVLHSKVADRLIERSTGGEEMLGLAIAWHCMRSGRVKEAGEWLVAGGREALRRSALAEAETALESGARHLPRVNRSDLAALLVEVYLDQGRIADAHTLSETLSHSSGGISVAHPITLLASLARAGKTPMYQFGAFDELLAVFRRLESAEHRLQAATIASGIAASVRDGNQLARLRDLLEEARAGAQPHEEARYSLLIAQTAYWQRDIDKAESILTFLREEHSEDGPTMYRYNLHMGLSTCSVARGNYIGSVAHAEQAVVIAGSAGAVAKEIMAIENLAIVHLRLGKMDDAYGSAERAIALAGSTEDVSRATAALGVALVVTALRSDVQRYQFYVTQLRAFIAQPTSTALSVVAGLWLADGLHLGGHSALAIDAASHAVRQFSVSHLGCFGIAARWAGKLLETRDDSTAKTVLQDAIRLHEKVDMLDKLEIALSGLTHQSIAPNDHAALRKLADRAASQLPAPAIALLSRLGLPTQPYLPANEAPASIH